VPTLCRSSYYLSAGSCKQCTAIATSACPNECLTTGFYSVGATCVACATDSKNPCNSACLLNGYVSTKVITTGDNPTTTTTCAKCDSFTLSCSVKDNTATPTQATLC